jgi:hypothetical protein
LAEKKRFLGEVIHKIKVDSKDEVHLFLKPPQRVNSLGLTVPSGSPFVENIQKAFCKIVYSLIDYYNDKQKSTKL